MPWAFLVWVLCFWLQAVLVGFAFYTLIQLYDFEEDLTNNFDCAKRCNRLVVRRLALIGPCTAPTDMPLTIVRGQRRRMPGSSADSVGSNKRAWYIVGVASCASTCIRSHFAGPLANASACCKPETAQGLQIPELVIQCLVLLLSLSSGHIVAALLNFAGAALLVHRFVQGKHLLDSLELWKQLPQAKRTSYMKLAAFGGAFAFIMFRCAAFLLLFGTLPTMCRFTCN